MYSFFFLILHQIVSVFEIQFFQEKAPSPVCHRCTAQLSVLFKIKMWFTTSVVYSR